MVRPLAWAFAGGLASALLFLSFHGGPAFIMVQYIAHLPLFAVGFAFGLVPVVVAGATAATVATITNLVTGLVFVVAYALPVAMVVRYGLLSRDDRQGGVEWYPAGEVLARISAYAGLTLLIAAVIMMPSEGGLRGQVVALVQSVASGLNEGAVPRLLEDTLERYAFVFPALFGVSWTVMIVINAVLALALVHGRGRALRPPPAYATLALPDWLAYGLGASALAWLVTGPDTAFVGGALMVILATPFFFQGLAVVHAISRNLAWRMFFLVLLYALMVFMPWLMLVIVILGVIEQWAGLRRRFA